MYSYMQNADFMLLSPDQPHFKLIVLYNYYRIFEFTCPKSVIFKNM
jgi:hypothetical protein